MSDLRQVGIIDSTFQLLTVDQLIADGVLHRPMDGNHGEQHPKVSDYVSEGIPFIMANDIANGRIDYENCNFITMKQADALRKGFSKPGDVLVTHKATIGRTALVGEEASPYIMLTPQVTYYRIKNLNVLNNRYLRHYLDCELFQKTLSIWAGAGSTRAYLGITGQRKLPIVVPPLSKQLKIAAILTAYDDLIEINKRRIALLEKMADELYREWFVRLRFPGYQNTRFVKGVPEGWTAVPSSDLLKVCSGGTPKTDEPTYWDGDVPLFTPRDAGDEIYVTTTEKWITESGLASCNSQLYPKNTIFITARGTVGKLALAQRSMAMNQSCYALIPKLNLDIYFFYLAMRNAVSFIKGVSKSGVFDNIVVDTFKIIPIYFPGENLISQFNQLADPIFIGIDSLLTTNINLTKTRDLLLPRLISGKLSVEDLDIQFPPSMLDEADGGGQAA